MAWVPVSNARISCFRCARSPSLNSTTRELAGSRACADRLAAMSDSTSIRRIVTARNTQLDLQDGGTLCPAASWPGMTTCAWML